jgi:hypothetical protein
VRFKRTTYNTMAMFARALLVSAALGSLPGCATHSAAYFASSGAAADGGLFVSASVALGSATANALAVAGVIAYLIAANDGYAPAPRMREDRTVHEQDCTKPIEKPTANLKCR